MALTGRRCDSPGCATSANPSVSCGPRVFSKDTDYQWLRPSLNARKWRQVELLKKRRSCSKPKPPIDRWWLPAAGKPTRPPR